MRSLSLQPARRLSGLSPGLRLLLVSGALLLLGYIAFFALLESPTVPLYTTLVQETWPGFFNRILTLFPTSWTGAIRHTSEFGPPNSALYILLLAYLLAVYLWAAGGAMRPAVFRATSRRASLPVILAYTALILGILLAVRGMFSTDLFNYAWYGRIFALQGGNPYINVATDYARYDTTGWLHWGVYLNVPCVYGPLWVFMAGGVSLIAQAAGGGLVTHLLGHRLLASGAHLVNTWLVWKAAGLFIDRYRRVPDLPAGVAPESWQTAARVAATIAYAWNPLLLVEFGVSAHNDVLVITFLLAAIWLHLAGHWRMAVLGLACAGLIKFTALIFLPGYLWLLFWSIGHESAAARPIVGRVWTTLQASLLYAAAWVLCFIPFWEGPATLNAFVGSLAAQAYNHSLGKVIVTKLPEAIGHLASALGWQGAAQWANGPARSDFELYARWGLLLPVIVITVWVTWRARTFPRSIEAWGWALFAYLTLGAVWFWPWYTTWLVVPALFVGPGRLWGAIQVFCASSLTLYAIYPPLAGPLAALAGWGGLFIMAPPLLYVLWGWVHEPRARRQDTASTASLLAAPQREA